MATGQWVKVELLKAFPKIIKNRGADLNNNGKIDPHERLKDVNGNKQIGDLADFKKYYLNNRAAIEKRVKFFKWAASFDPGNLRIDNPLHDLLSIESEVARPADVKAAYLFLKGALSAAKPSFRKLRWYSGIMFNIHDLYQILRRQGIRYGESQLSYSLSDGVRQKMMDCDISSYAVMGLAYQLGITTLYAVDVPTHLFLRYDDGKRKFNVDFGVTASDSYYIGRYNISRASITKGRYLRNLTRRELIGLFYVNRAVIKLDKGDHTGAYKDFLRTSRLYPKLLGSPLHVASFKISLKDYNGAIKVLNRAIQLQPNNDLAYQTRGSVYIKLKQFRKAIQDFTQAIQINMKSARRVKAPNAKVSYLYLERGMAKYTLKDYKGAISDFTEAIRLYRSNADAYSMRSKARLQLNDYVRAYYDKYNACQLDPHRYQCKCKIIITPKPPGIQAVLTPFISGKPKCVIKVSPTGVVGQCPVRSP